jgi:hypothetical protein
VPGRFNLPMHCLNLRASLALCDFALKRVGMNDNAKPQRRQDARRTKKEGWLRRLRQMAMNYAQFPIFTPGAFGQGRSN